MCCYALLPRMMKLSSHHSHHDVIKPSSIIIPAALTGHDDGDVDQPSRKIVQTQSTTNDLYDSNGQNFGSILRGGGDITTSSLSSLSPTNNIIQSIKRGYNQRIAADSAFVSKSILEVILAASTQYMAEVSRRGKDRILLEMDFVFAGVLTAVIGKYYSMWRVARTVNADINDDDDIITAGATNTNDNNKEDTNWRDNVPTNAFQSTLLDGRTKPTIPNRILAFILPMPQLFRAGVIASTLGYGVTSVLVYIRTLVIPQYEVVTRAVSVPKAAIYTGCFMSLISNVRYQLLQGVVEPMIDVVFFKVDKVLVKNDSGSRMRLLLRRLLSNVKRAVIVFIRIGNGLLGSWIAIGGMRAFGLQQLK